MWRNKLAKDKTIGIRGTLDWAKIVGPARPYSGNPKYDKGPNWSVDITPDKKSRELLKENGIDDKLREPKGENDKRGETFLTLRQLENRTDGKKNPPPGIVDAAGKDWGQERLLGNGTVADIMVKVADYGTASAKGVYMQKVRILDHVPYGGGDFAPLSEDDKFFAEGSEVFETDAEAPAKDNLDDDAF